jgi:MoxR-like ATPase
MDRFLMKVSIDYPEDDAELGIIRLVRGEEAPGQSAETSPVEQSHIFTAREQIHELSISENIEHYIVALVMATRDPARYPQSDLQHWISVGSSPRASIALDKSARAHAWLKDRAFVDPDDVRAVAQSVLRHRLILTYDAQADGISSEDVIEEILKQVAIA